MNERECECSSEMVSLGYLSVLKLLPTHCLTTACFTKNCLSLMSCPCPLFLTPLIWRWQIVVHLSVHNRSTWSEARIVCSMPAEWHASHMLSGILCPFQMRYGDSAVCSYWWCYVPWSLSCDLGDLHIPSIMGWPVCVYVTYIVSMLYSSSHWWCNFPPPFLVFRAQSCADEHCFKVLPMPVGEFEEHLIIDTHLSSGAMRTRIIAYPFCPDVSVFWTHHAPVLFVL